jgi:hypothetical protein
VHVVRVKINKGKTICRLRDCLSCRLTWVPPPQASVAPPQDPSGGKPHSLAGEGVGGPNSDDWTDTLVLYTVTLYGENGAYFICVCMTVQ